MVDSDKDTSSVVLKEDIKPLKVLYDLYLEKRIGINFEIFNFDVRSKVNIPIISTFIFNVLLLSVVNIHVLKPVK